MNKKQKKMLTKILIAAAMVIVLNLVPVTGILQLVLYFNRIFGNWGRHFKKGMERDFKQTGI